MVLVVVEAVLTPVVGVRQRSVDKRREFLHGVLQRGKRTFLHHVARVVAIDHVAHVQFLILPVGVGSVVVVLAVDAVHTSGVDEIVTAHHVADDSLVYALIVAQVNTRGHVQHIEEAVLIGAHQSVPVVIVAVLGKNQLRSVLRSSVQVFHCSVVERTVIATEDSRQHAVVGTARQVTVRIGAVGACLCRVTETATDTRVERGRKRRLVVDLPYVVQADLRLVVLVVVCTFLLAVVGVTVRRVVATVVHAVGHIFLHVVPLGQGERTARSARALPVTLRSTETCQRELVLLVDALRDVGEIAVSAVTRALDVSVTPYFRAQHRDGPSAGAKTRADGEEQFVRPVVAQRVGDYASALGVDTLGDDVDRTAHGRSAHFAGAHTALGLHHGRHVAQTLPVAPVDRTAFHVVHRHTVDHRGHVRIVETAHPDLRVAPAAALSVGMHARRVLQDLGELGAAQTLLYLQRVDLADCHRRLAHLGHLAHDRHVLQHHRHSFHGDSTHVLHRNQDERFVAYVTEFDLGVRANRQREVSVQVSHHAVRRAVLQHTRTDDRLAVFCVHHCA